MKHYKPFKQRLYHYKKKTNESLRGVGHNFWRFTVLYGEVV